MALVAIAAAGAGAAARGAYTVERVVNGLNQPIYMTQAPNDNSSIYIVERADASSQLGKIRKYDLQAHTFTTFLDPTGTVTSDGGLLSLTFHPDYANNGLFYVVSNNNGTNGLDEYKTIGGVPALQRRILQYQNLNNVYHTMNQAHFRPNGNNNELFITTGDGGTQADEAAFNKALIESPTSPYGKLLKVDLTHTFATPASAPGPGTGITVSALGIRNPYRSGFDRQTGDFYFGDVGFNTVESVDFIPSSFFANPASPVLDFGWTDREGTIATIAPFAGGPGSPGDVKPILDYAHTGQAGSLPHASALFGNSVTGGYVYRGPVGELQGRYFFADFTNGNVYSGAFNNATPTASFNGQNITGITNHTANFESLVGAGTNIQFVNSFGEDNAGNLYIVKFGNGFFPPLGQGEIFKITPVLSGTVVANINRNTGAITLNNSTGTPVSFTSYTVSSNVGAIDSSSLTPVTGHYDFNGDKSVDLNDPWQVTSGAGSHVLFSEATTGDAGAIAANSQVVLSAGGGWIPSPTEDMFVSLLLSNGTILNATVNFTGNGGQAFVAGDIDFDGGIDVDDWSKFLAHSYTTLGTSSRAESYGLGDLDGDGDSDFSDFRLFKSDYDAFNGVGAFTAMSGIVPEPVSAPLAVVAVLGAFVMWSRPSRTRAAYALAGAAVRAPHARRGPNLFQSTSY